MTPSGSISAALVVTLLLLAPGPGAAAEPEPLSVAVAISLRPAIDEAAALFVEQRTDARLRVHAGGSGLLMQQLRRGAPFDLFISASADEIERLERAGRVRGASRRTLAGNRLVVVVPREATPPATAAGLSAPVYDRIATGNPRTAPLGRYAEDALRALGLWESLERRIIPAENARQALEYVARGEVAAGILYRSDARLAGDRIRLGPELPSHAQPDIRYEAAILTDARRPDLAAELLDLLQSAAGREILERHGFIAPSTAVPE